MWRVLAFARLALTPTLARKRERELRSEHRRARFARREQGLVQGPLAAGANQVAGPPDLPVSALSLVLSSTVRHRISGAACAAGMHGAIRPGVSPERHRGGAADELLVGARMKAMTAIKSVALVAVMVAFAATSPANAKSKHARSETGPLIMSGSYGMQASARRSRSADIRRPVTIRVR